jgi:acetyl esterase
MLDPRIAAMTQAARAAGAPDLCDLPPAAARGLYRQILATADRPACDVGVQDALARDDREPAAPLVPLRIYSPREAGPYGLVVYFHGGGYALGDLDGYDAVCRQLCADSGAVVVSVGYRLAPEHPYPAAVDDAWTALRWVAAHASDWNADAVRLAVAGDSAGAVLATVVAILARDARGPRIAFQALLYPPAAGGHEGAYPSRERHADGPTLTLRTMHYFSRLAFGPEGSARDFRGAPLLAQDLSGLPAGFVMVAAHDPLRDEAVAYGEALARAGSDVTIVEYLGLPHGFISMAGAVPAARAAQLQLGQALRSALVPAPAGESA